MENMRNKRFLMVPWNRICNRTMLSFDVVISGWLALRSDEEMRWFKNTQNKNFLPENKQKIAKSEHKRSFKEEMDDIAQELIRLAEHSKYVDQTEKTKTKPKATLKTFTDPILSLKKRRNPEFLSKKHKKENLIFVSVPTKMSFECFQSIVMSEKEIPQNTTSFCVVVNKPPTEIEISEGNGRPWTFLTEEKTPILTKNIEKIAFFDKNSPDPSPISNCISYPAQKDDFLSKISVLNERANYLSHSLKWEPIKPSARSYTSAIVDQKCPPPPKKSLFDKKVFLLQTKIPSKKSNLVQELKIKPLAEFMRGQKRTLNSLVNLSQSHLKKFKMRRRPDTLTDQVQRVLPCPFCHKKFKRSAHVLSHMNTHMLEKRAYSCRYCGASFSFMSGMRRHEKTHTGESIVYCEVCGKKFFRTHRLNLHRIRDHPGVISTAR